MFIDSVGGIDGDGSSKRYLHILADYLYRYALFFTFKVQSARVFISLINSIVKQHNIKINIADQLLGINFKKIKNYMQTRNIPLIFIFVYCQKSKGLNKRLIRHVRNIQAN